MIKLHQDLKPLIRVIQPSLNTYALQKVIEDYIEENSLPSFYRGQVVNALSVTGQAQEHHLVLRYYLNSANDVPLVFRLTKGFFMTEDIEHHWLQSDNLIIDLSIQQFKKYPYLQENPLIKISDFSYLICDNPQDLIHQLYFEELV